MSGDALDAFRAEKDFNRFTIRLALDEPAKLSGGKLGANGNDFRMVTRDLLGNEVHVRAGGQRDHLKSPRKRLDDVEGLAADGTGGT